jgi:hypothetical protein
MKSSFAGPRLAWLWEMLTTERPKQTCPIGDTGAPFASSSFCGCGTLHERLCQGASGCQFRKPLWRPCTRPRCQSRPGSPGPFLAVAPPPLPNPIRNLNIRLWPHGHSEPCQPSHRLLPLSTHPRRCSHSEDGPGSYPAAPGPLPGSRQSAADAVWLPHPQGYRRWK